MWADFSIPISWGELFRRTAKDISEDDVLGLAAQLAYFFFLALFPALLCLLALASLLPIDHIMANVSSSMSAVLPKEVVPLIRDQIVQVTSSPQGSLFTVGFLGALWSSSAALVAVTGALNRAYDIEEGRPWWKVRITAILLTVGVAFFALVALVIFVAGPEIGAALAERFGMGGVFQMAWNILQWPVALALVVVAVGLIYYFAPDADQDWIFLTPGSVVAVVLWAIASLGFRYYVTSFGNYTETYGAIAGVVLLMLWFYISGLALLVGAELNAEIEHASPHAKAPGEKVPGEKKKIGARAARAYKEKLSGREGRIETLRNQYPVVPGYARRGVMLGGVILGLFRRKVGS